VEFDSQKSYQQALSKKNITVPNIGTVTVEERRPKDQRSRQSYDNYQRNYSSAPHNSHNGINSQRGGGGRGMERRNTASRHSSKSYS